MEKLQIIFTHDKGQDVANVPLELVNMTSKDKAIASLKILLSGKYSFLDPEWKEKAYANISENGGIRIPEELKEVPELVKISMCIITDKKEKPKSPKWYNECHGKIYFNSLNS